MAGTGVQEDPYQSIGINGKRSLTRMKFHFVLFPLNNQKTLVVLLQIMPKNFPILFEISRIALNKIE
ncbi:MAG: hypothetical protein WA941_16240 [Nitrososphaeraceae archaeon]